MANPNVVVDITSDIAAFERKLMSDLNRIASRANFTIKVNADIAEARAEIESLSQEITVHAILDDAAVRAELEALTAEVSVNVATDGIDAAKAEVDDLGAGVTVPLDVAADGLDAAQATVFQLGMGITVPIDAPYDMIETALALAADLSAGVTIPIDVAMDGLEAAQAILADMEAGITVPIDVADGALEDAATGGQGFEAQGKDAGESFSKGMSGGILARSALVAGAYATVRGVGGGVSEGVDFEANLNRTAASVNLTTKQTRALAEQTLALGNNYKLPAVTAAEAAESAQKFAFAGIDVTKVTNQEYKANEALVQAMRLKIITGENVDDSTKQIIQTMKTFGLQGKDMVDVVTAIGGTDAQSSASALELAQSLKYSSGAISTMQAKSMGAIPAFREQVGFLGLMADRGLAASTAGTGLNRFLEETTGKTKQAATGIKTLSDRYEKLNGPLKDGGDIFFNQAGQARSLEDQFTNLGKSVEGMTDLQKRAATQAIFHANAQRIVDRALNLSTEDWAKAKKGTEDYAATQRIVEASSHGVKGGIDAVSSSFSTLFSQLVLNVSPVLTPLLQGFAQQLNKIPGLISDVSSGLKDFFSGGTGAGISDAFSKIDFAGIYAKAQEIWDKVKDAFSSGIAFIKSYADAIDWGALLGHLETAFKGVEQFFKGLFESIAGIFDVFKGIIHGNWREIWNGLKEIFGGIWDQVVGFMKTAIGGLGFIWEAIAPVVKGAFKLIWDPLVDVFNASWGVIRGIISTAVDVGAAVFDGIATAAETAGRWIGNAGQKIGEFIGWVARIVRGPIDAVSTAFEKAMGWAGDAMAAVGRFIDKVLSIAGGTIKAISDAFEKVVTWAGNAMAKVGDFIGKILAIVARPVLDIVSAFGDVIGKVKDAIAWVGNLLGKILGLPKKITIEIFTSLTGWLTGGDVAGKLRAEATAKAAAATGGKAVAHAAGGYFDKATFGLFGEAGPEVILPLTDPARMQELLSMPQVSEAIANSLGAEIPVGTSTGTGTSLADLLTRGASTLGASAAANAGPAEVKVSVNFDDSVNKLVAALDRLTEKITGTVIDGVRSVSDEFRATTERSFADSRDIMAKIENDNSNIVLKVDEMSVRSFADSRDVVSKIEDVAVRTFADSRDVVSKITETAQRSFADSRDVVSRIETVARSFASARDVVSRFAAGTVASVPTPGIFGDDGPELLLPLSPRRMRDAKRLLARADVRPAVLEALGMSGGLGTGTTHNWHLPDTTDMEQLVDAVAMRERSMGGSTLSSPHLS